MSCVWIKFLLISSLISLVELITLECDYQMDTYKDYTCFAKSSFEVNSKNDRTIDDVVGTHMDGKSNADVVAFGSKDHTIKFFPKGLEKFFPKLQVIDIENSELQEITSEDLAPLGNNLKTLYIANNEIEDIEHNTFQLNPELVSVSLKGNHVKYVGPGAFTKLANLAVLQFDDNICYSDSVHDNAEKVNIFAHEIEKECTRNNEKNIVNDIHESLSDIKGVVDGLLERLRV